VGAAGRYCSRNARAFEASGRASRTTGIHHEKEQDMDNVKKGLYGWHAVKHGTPDRNLDRQTMLVDALANVMHYAHLEDGVDFASALDSAWQHFDHEINEGAEPEAVDSPITIMEAATHMLGRSAMNGADYQEAGLPIMGGCEHCGASIAAYNAYPSTSGYLRCADCIGPDGYATADAFVKASQR
jgi:hypothetical protein